MEEIQAMDQYILWIVKDKLDEKNKISSERCMDEDEYEEASENMRHLNKHLLEVS